MKYRAIALMFLMFGLAPWGHADSHGGFYAGTGAGLYYMDFDDLDFDEGAATLRGYAGYKFNRFIGLEAGYTKLFEVSDDLLGVDVDIDGDVWDISARPTLPISDSFRAFGIVGWSNYDWSIAASGPGVVVTDSADGDELHFGVGAEVDFTDNWTLRGEWITVDVSDADFGMFSASVSYNF